MNIEALHPEQKAVSSIPLFTGGEGKTIALQILAQQQLKAHHSPVPALLVCVKGQIIFHEEGGQERSLFPGDYVNIVPMIKHWVNATEDSQLLLIK